MIRFETYTVQFWCGTDLRAEEKVRAASAIQALSVASISHEYYNWCTYGEDMFIKVIVRK